MEINPTMRCINFHGNLYLIFYMFMGGRRVGEQYDINPVAPVLSSHVPKNCESPITKGMWSWKGEDNITQSSPFYEYLSLPVHTKVWMGNDTIL